MRDLAGMLTEAIARHHVPGASVGLLADGDEVTATAGVADVRSARPVAIDERFAIGSLTKPMVATVLLRLANEGLLSLDDPIAGHVPELEHSAWAGRATVRDLLANRGRLPLRSAWEFDGIAGNDDQVLSLFAAALASAPASPSGWSYTNAGWSLLGRLIECLTGRVWEEAMREHLFDPLGMSHTTFAAAPVRESRAVGHDVTPVAPRPVPGRKPRVFGPSGMTVLASVDDLLRFARHHLQDPLAPGMREPHADVVIHGWLDGWCLGWAKFDWAGETAWGWDGLVAGQRSALRLLPDRHAAVVIVTNGSTGRALVRSLLARLVGERFGLRPPDLRLSPAPHAAGDLARYAGLYAWPDRAYTVSVRGDRLLIDGGGRTDEAHAVDRSVFLVDRHDPDNPTVTFAGFDASGRPSLLYRMLWGYHRQPDD